MVLCKACEKKITGIKYHVYTIDDDDNVHTHFYVCQDCNDNGRAGIDEYME